MDQRANLESDVATELLTKLIDAAGAATGENMDQAREFVEHDEKGLAIGILLAMAADQDWQPDRATVERLLWLAVALKGAPAFYERELKQAAHIARAYGIPWLSNDPRSPDLDGRCQPPTSAGTDDVRRRRRDWKLLHLVYAALASICLVAVLGTGSLALASNVIILGLVALVALPLISFVILARNGKTAAFLGAMLSFMLVAASILVGIGIAGMIGAAV